MYCSAVEQKLCLGDPGEVSLESRSRRDLGPETYGGYTESSFEYRPLRDIIICKYYCVFILNGPIIIIDQE